VVGEAVGAAAAVASVCSVERDAALAVYHACSAWPIEVVVDVGGTVVADVGGVVVAGDDRAVDGVDDGPTNGGAPTTVGELEGADPLAVVAEFD
jgi:hypothetical protein